MEISPPTLLLISRKIQTNVLPLSKEGGLVLCVSVITQFLGSVCLLLPFLFLSFLSPINKINGASLVTQMVKNPPEVLETRVPSLG